MKSFICCSSEVGISESYSPSHTVLQYWKKISIQRRKQSTFIDNAKNIFKAQNDLLGSLSTAWFRSLLGWMWPWISTSLDAVESVHVWKKWKEKKNSIHWIFYYTDHQNGVRVDRAPKNFPSSTGGGEEEEERRGDEEVSKLMSNLSLTHPKI